MQPIVTALGLVVLVALAALLLRIFSSQTPSRSTAGLPPPNPEPAPVEEDEDDFDPSEAVAVTSDGWSFVPSGNVVHLVPPSEPDEPWRGSTGEPERGPVHPHTGGRVEAMGHGGHLAPGDFIAARVRRGSPGLDPWRLEALGRDHEFVSWEFETRDAAHAALEAIEKRVVRPPRDEDGHPIPVGEEDFVIARRKREQTESELAVEPWEDEDSDPIR